MQVDRCIGSHIRRTFTRQEAAQHRCSSRCSATVSKEPGCALWARSWLLMARWLRGRKGIVKPRQVRMSCASRAEEPQLKTAGLVCRLSRDAGAAYGVHHLWCYWTRRSLECAHYQPAICCQAGGFALCAIPVTTLLRHDVRAQSVPGRRESSGMIS